MLPGHPEPALSWHSGFREGTRTNALQLRSREKDIWSGKAQRSLRKKRFVNRPRSDTRRNLVGQKEDDDKQAAKTRTELEALVLAELRAAPQCGSAVHVTVVPYDNYRVPAIGEVASFDPGTSEWEECERALCDIVSRLQQRFDIAR